MRFVEKIKAHQEGRYDLATELVKLALSNMVKTEMVCIPEPVVIYTKEIEEAETRYLPRWRPNYIKKKNTMEYQVAYNLRVFIKKHGKKAKSILKTLNVGTKEQRLAFDGEDYLYSKLADLGIHYHVDEFHMIPKKILNKVELSYGEDYYGWSTWNQLYKERINILRHVNKEISKLENEITPLILESLYEVIPLIDLNYSEKQILGFITLAVKNRTYRKLTKKLGTKVHQINGEKYIVLKKNSKMKQTNIDRMLGVNHGKLTSNQYAFYKRLKNLIQVEIEKRNTTPFTFNKENEIININKRYFSEQMENMEESAFKKRLKRLQDKKDKDFFASKAI